MNKNIVLVGAVMLALVVAGCVTVPPTEIPPMGHFDDYQSLTNWDNVSGFEWEGGKGYTQTEDYLNRIYSSAEYTSEGNTSNIAIRITINTTSYTRFNLIFLNDGEEVEKLQFISDSSDDVVTWGYRVGATGSFKTIGETTEEKFIFKYNSGDINVYYTSDELDPIFEDSWSLSTVEYDRIKIEFKASSQLSYISYFSLAYIG